MSNEAMITYRQAFLQKVEIPLKPRNQYVMPGLSPHIFISGRDGTDGSRWMLGGRGGSVLAGRPHHPSPSVRVQRGCSGRSCSALLGGRCIMWQADGRRNPHVPGPARLSKTDAFVILHSLARLTLINTTRCSQRAREDAGLDAPFHDLTY